MREGLIGFGVLILVFAGAYFGYLHGYTMGRRDERDGRLW